MAKQQPSPPQPSPYYSSSADTRQQQNYNESDYQEIYYHFEDYASEILVSNTLNFLNQDNPQLYEAEDEILDEYADADWEGIQKSCLFGLGCGLLSLGGLRSFRRWRVGLQLKRMGGGTGRPSGSSGGYQFDPVPNQPQLHSSQSFHHHNINAPPSRMGLDVTLSLLLGMGTTLFAVEYDVFYPTVILNKTDLQNKNSASTNMSTTAIVGPPPPWISPQIPLVPGRSIISDTLCEPLTEEFRKFPKELWNKNGNQNHLSLLRNGGWKDTKYYDDNPNASIVAMGESVGVDEGAVSGNGISGGIGISFGNIVGGNGNKTFNGKGVYEYLLLDSLQEFVINCERRTRHEQRLRKIRGTKKDIPVVIPKDGVSADEELELDDIYLLENDNKRDDDSGIYGDCD